MTPLFRPHRQGNCLCDRFLCGVFPSPLHDYNHLHLTENRENDNQNCQNRSNIKIIICKSKQLITNTSDLAVFQGGKGDLTLPGTVCAAFFLCVLLRTRFYGGFSGAFRDGSGGGFSALSYAPSLRRVCHARSRAVVPLTVAPCVSVCTRTAVTAPFLVPRHTRRRMRDKLFVSLRRTCVACRRQGIKPPHPAADRAGTPVPTDRRSAINTTTHPSTMKR